MPVPRRLQLAFLLLAAVWLGLRLPSAIAGAWTGAATDLADARVAVTHSPAQRIEAHTRIGPDLLAAIAANLPDDGVLVVYSSLPGEVARGLYLLQYERIRNLLYPRPRRVIPRHRDDLEDVADLLELGEDGKLLVVDYSSPQAPPFGEPFRLVATGGFARLWSR